MKKVIIWLLALGGGLVALLIAAVFLAPRFIDIETYRPEIEEKVKELTGRSFTLGSDFDVSVFPWIGVSFSNLQLGNPEEFGGGEFLKVDSFEARVKLLPLLSRKIEIKTFVLDGPEIQLIKRQDGQGNWSMADKKIVSAKETDKKPMPETGAGEEGGFALSSLEVGDFAITNGRIIYLDQAAAVSKEVDNITFKLQDISLERPVNLLFQANFDGKPVSVQGSVGPIGKNPGSGTVAFDLLVNALQQVELKMKGNVVEPATEQKFTLDLSVSPFSLRQLMDALELPFPMKTSDPGVFNRMGLDLHVKGDPNTIEIEKSAFFLDETDVAISAVVKEMSQPDLSFQLKLNGINVDRYLPVPEEKTEGKKGGKATATANAPAAEPAQIDYEPLRKLLLSGDVEIGKLIAHGVKIENMVLKVTGKNGIFNLDPCALDLYNGNIVVVAQMDVRKQKPTGDVTLNAGGIQVGPLLRDGVKKDILEGVMNGSAAISFSGENGDEIKKTLSGSGDLSFVDGAIVGIDIAELGRTLSSGLNNQQPREKPRTDFAELTVPFVLKNGLFQTKDTYLGSPLLRVNAFGTADLVSEKLDMKVRPKIVGSLKGQGGEKEQSGLTVPLHVGGTFSQPEYTADLSAVANEETIKEMIADPEGTKEKMKSLEESGKALLQGFGFGN